MAKRRWLQLTALVMALLLQAAAGQAAEGVLRATLQNGLRVVIVRNTLAPAVAVAVNYRVGSVESPPGFPGMAHAQEHMMFRGSPGLSAAQLATVMAGLGGESNADTQQVVTQYTATVAATDLETVLRVEATRMAAVNDSEKDWTEERGAIEQEVEQDLSNPQYLLYVRLLKKLFAGTPYEHDALGSRASFDATTAVMLQKFHRDWYAPNNAILVLVGDVEPRRTLKKVEAIFGKIVPRPLPARPHIKLQPLKPDFLQLESDLPYGAAVLAYRLPGFNSPDYAAGVILGDVLASQRGNIYALVPEGKALAAGFEEMPFPEAAAGLVTAAFPQGGDGKAVLASLRQVIAGYLRTGIPPELVAAAKQQEVAELEFAGNSIPDLAAAWSEAVAVEGRNSPQDDIAAIRRVSVDDVNRVARACLADDGAIAALLLPRASGKPVQGKGFARGKESFAPKSVKPVKLPRWARTLTKTVPAEKALKKPTVYKLANGLRLMVVGSGSSEAVSLYGEVKNNASLQQPPGKEGVDDLLSALFSYGSVEHDRLSFQAALDDIAADESAGSSFRLRVLKGHFPRGVELLAENLLQPALPQDAFKVVQQETAGALAGELQSPGWLTRHAMERGLYPKGDPKLRHATPESVGALTLEDVRRYHRSVFRPDQTTIVVVGAVSPEAVKAVIERYFGSWRAAGPPPVTDLPAVPLNTPSVVNVPDTSRSQDEVTLVETLALKRAHPDFYPLQVGLRVLSGGFYATRLYRDLRQRTGLVYTVEAFLETSRNRSVFGVYYASAPESVDKARRLVEENLYQMQKEAVSPAELLQAKTILLRQMLLARTSDSGIAEDLLHLVRLGLPVDEPDRAAKRYRQTTARQVKRVFARWVRPAAFVQVVRGPAPR